MVMTEVLRTAEVAEADRFAQWRHWISSTFVPMECARVSRRPFSGEVAHWTLGDLQVSRVDADAHRASRTPRMIAARDEDCYKVGLAIRGSSCLTQRDREVLITTDSPWWHNLEGGAPVELRLRGRRVRATAEAVRDPDRVAEALTALVQDHPPYGRWAHIGVGADGRPDAADVRAEVARGRVLVRVQLPDEAKAAR